jgi:hypothetical protein
VLTKSSEKFIFRALTDAVCIGFVLSEMVDVGKYGQYNGKVSLLCPGWYV